VYYVMCERGPVKSLFDSLKKDSLDNQSKPVFSTNIQYRKIALSS